MQTYKADGDWRYAARTVTDRCLDTSVLSAMLSVCLYIIAGSRLL